MITAGREGRDEGGRRKDEEKAESLVSIPSAFILHPSSLAFIGRGLKRNRPDPVSLRRLRMIDCRNHDSRSWHKTNRRARPMRAKLRRWRPARSGLANWQPWSAAYSQSADYQPVRLALDRRKDQRQTVP